MPRGKAIHGAGASKTADYWGAVVRMMWVNDLLQGVVLTFQGGRPFLAFECPTRRPDLSPQLWEPTLDVLLLVKAASVPRFPTLAVCEATDGSGAGGEQPSASAAATSKVRVRLSTSRFIAVSLSCSRVGERRPPRCVLWQASDFEKAVYDELFALRRRVASQDGVAPFNVMSENVMRQLAMSRPTTTVALAKLGGLPAHVLTTRGPAIVELIKSLCEKQMMPTDVEPRAAVIQVAGPRSVVVVAVSRRPMVSHGLVGVCVCASHVVHCMISKLQWSDGRSRPRSSRRGTC